MKILAEMVSGGSSVYTAYLVKCYKRGSGVFSSNIFSRPDFGEEQKK